MTLPTCLARECYVQRSVNPIVRLSVASGSFGGRSLTYILVDMELPNARICMNASRIVMDNICLHHGIKDPTRI